MAPRRALENTAAEVIEAYHAWTLDSFLSIRTDDCVNEILPTSLGRPTMNNRQYCEFIGPMLTVIRGFTLEKQNLTIDAEQNQFVLHMKSSAESDLGPYAGEYMVTIVTTEDGKKVKRFEEFVDVASSMKYVTPLRELIEKRARET